jgi:ubiquinone/menaquinone biosynthesis C-methylase UbiE
MTDRAIAHNRAAHDRLGDGYDERHPEIFNDTEQARLRAAVGRAVGAMRGSGTDPVMLDVGAGSGNLTSWMLEHPGRVIAADLSAGMLASLLARVGSEHPGRVSGLELNGTDLRPLADRSIDLAAAYSVLHHIPDYLAMVAEMARVVRPGGVVYIDHEKAPAYWERGAALTRFLADAVIRPPRRWWRFIDPSSYWRRIRPLLVWQRWSDPRWMPEGDLHIWPDDHVEWDAVERTLVDAGCEIVERVDYLAYEPRYRRDAWERARAARVSDTRRLVARRVA